MSIKIKKSISEQSKSKLFGRDRNFGKVGIGKKTTHTDTKRCCIVNTDSETDTEIEIETDFNTDTDFDTDSITDTDTDKDKNNNNNDTDSNTETYTYIESDKQ